MLTLFLYSNIEDLRVSRFIISDGNAIGTWSESVMMVISQTASEY
jgi:hypothetical protein